MIKTLYQSSEMAASDPVHRALEGFSMEAGDAYPGAQWLHEHADDTTRVLRMFTELGANALNAAGLQRLAIEMDGSPNETVAQAAARAILENYMDPEHTPSKREVNYGFSILDSVLKAKESSVKYMGRLSESREGYAILAELDKTDGSPLPKGLYNVKIGIDIPEMAHLAEGVDLEAIYIAAADAMHRVARPEHNDPRAQVRAMFEAESLLTPTVGALGMSAYEMALHGPMKRARIIGAGRWDLLYRAEALASVDHAVVEQVVHEELFGTTSDNPVFGIDTMTPYGSPIYYTSYEHDTLTNGRFSGKLHARGKTPESIAYKSLVNQKYESVEPQDIFGMTSVVEDETQVAAMLEYIVGKVEKSDKLEFAVAASKRMALSGQGRKEFYEKLEANLDPEIYRAIDFAPPSDQPPGEVHQVVKVTFNAITDEGIVRCEYQCQTEFDRDASQRGGANHLEYETRKAGEHGDYSHNIRGDAGILKVIAQRRHTAQRDAVKKDRIARNAESARSFRQKIERRLWS